MPGLKVKMGTLELENPIIISAGHVTRRPADIMRADKFGAGAIAIKTPFLEKEYREVVRPCENGEFPDARANFVSTNTGDGLLGICGLSPIPVEGWVKWFKENKKNLKTPIIATLAAISVEGYVEASKMFQEAGADALELMLACPLPYLKPFKYIGGASFHPELMEEICKAVRPVLDIPFGVKLMYNPVESSSLLTPLKMGCDFVTVCLAMPAAPGIDLEKLEPKVPSSVFVSGAQASKYATFTALLQMAGQRTHIHISTSGGTQSWEDIVEYVMYGASSVQIQTAFIKNGFRIIEEWKRNIAEFMERKGFKSLEELKGFILPMLLTYEEVIAAFGPTKGKIYSSVDEEKCTLCGICPDLCIYGALEITDGRLKIDRALCEACNICVDRCPESALKLENMWIMRS